MKSVLICARKNKDDIERAEEAQIGAAYEALGKDLVKVVHDDQLPWADLRAVHGSYNAAYTSIGQKYDVLVLVEAFDGQHRTIARGQFAIAHAALEAGRAVRVRRGQLVPVRAVAILDDTDWSRRYGRVLV